MMNRPATRPGERGAIVIVFAVIVIAIMSMATLALDGGLLYKDRSNDQNAADHAALAAAWASCTGEEDPTTAGLAAAAANGFDNDGSTNTVTISSTGTHIYEASVASNRDPAFAGTQGVTTLAAKAWAVAKCTAGEAAGGAAIFAHSTSCGKTVDISGSDNVITGRVHSNHIIDIGGSNNTFEGEVTYVTSINDGGGGNTFNPAPQKVDGPEPYPITAPIADYAPGGAKAIEAGSQYYSTTGKIDSSWLEDNGLLNESTGELATGLYYTTGDIDIGDSDLHGTVTFVSSGGQIKISGGDQDLTNWDPLGLLAYSNADRSCGEYGVALSGSTSSWTGILFAPRAMIEMSGSSNSTFSGALIGDEVRLNGSTLGISFDGGAQIGEPKVAIIE